MKKKKTRKERTKIEYKNDRKWEAFAFSKTFFLSNKIQVPLSQVR